MGLPLIFVSMNYRCAFSSDHFMNRRSDATSFPVFLVVLRTIFRSLCRWGSSFVLTALGFLPGKEVKEAGVGNLGLQDRESTILWLESIRSCAY